MAPHASLKFRAIAYVSRFMVAPTEVAGPARSRADLLKAAKGPAILFGKAPELAAAVKDTIAGIPVRRYHPNSARPAQSYFSTVAAGYWEVSRRMTLWPRRLRPKAGMRWSRSTAKSAPAFVSVAQCDGLHDDGTAYAQKLREAGVEVTLEEVPGALHGFASMFGLKEARATVKRGAEWLRLHLG